MPYNLRNIRTPKLKGAGLRVVTTLMENALLRPLLLPKLFRDTGIAAFREYRPQEEPTRHPLVPPGQPVAEPEDRCSIAQVAGMVAASVPEAAGHRFASITDYARAYQEGDLSPVEVAEKVIAASETSNRSTPPLRAIIKCEAEDVRRQAAESARRLAEGNPRSLLEGVPVAIKNELDTTPYATQVGTGFLGDEVARTDATAVARLRAAGALLVGKTNMFEIGISPTGNNPIHGFARNPYSLHHDAGGSSGGSAAAVGAGLVPLALGADGGGSIRIPAAHCGIVGLKPTFGRTSEAGAFPLCESVAHVGPMGATARDVAIGYALCAGPDQKDPLSLQQPAVQLPDFSNHELSGITLGIYRPWFDDSSSEILKACRETMQALEQAGATIKEVTIAGLEEARVAHAIIILTEMAAAMEPYYGNHRKDFSHPARLSLALARTFSHSDYDRAQRIRTEAMKEWERVMTEVDAVLTPTTACPPPRLDPRTTTLGESDMSLQTQLMKFIVCGNLTGAPAISFPAGYTEAGLPIGLQAITRHWQEHLLLRLAHVADLEFERSKPAVFHDILA